MYFKKVSKFVLLFFFNFICFASYAQVMTYKSGNIYYDGSRYEKDEIASIMKKSQEGYILYNKALDLGVSSKNYAIGGGILTGVGILGIFLATNQREAKSIGAGIDNLFTGVFLISISIPSIVVGVTLELVALGENGRSNNYLNEAINEFNLEYGRIGKVERDPVLNLGLTDNGVGFAYIF